MRKKLAILLAVCLLFVCGSTVALASENTTYTYTISTNDDWIRTQDAYMPGNLYLRDLGLADPEDIFIKDRIMYVADTGNKRVIAYNIDTEEHRVIGEGILQNPRGTYVSDDNKIYIADGLSEKLQVFDMNGKLIQTIGKPNSYLFSELSTFFPKNVVVTSEGNIFVCGDGASEGLLQFDLKGEFQGYFAANKRYLTFTETVEDFILSEELKQKQFMRQPRPIYNLDVNNRDLVYTVTQTDEVIHEWAAARKKQENTLKQHNLAGVNILSREEFMVDEYNFVDVASGDYGNVYALTFTGLVFEYDREGQLVFSFGGLSIGGERSGVFTYANAIETDDNGFIYILDREKGYVQVFYPTDFAVATHQAIYDMENGNYAASESTWNAVLKLNGSSRIAHMGYGKTLFHQQRFDEALEEFRIAQNREYYSDAYWELRDEWLSNNIIYILGVIILFIIYVIVSSIIEKRRPVKEVVKVKEIPKTPWKRFLHDITYFRFMLRHPIDGYYYLKRGDAGSMKSASFLYAIFLLVFLADTLFRGFIFGFASLNDTPFLLMAIAFIAVIFLFIIGNYMVATINEGEGSIKNLYIMLPYAVSPYLVIAPCLVAVSYVLTQNEAFIITFGWALAVIWAAVLVFIGITETHNYTFGETVKNVLLTLFFMVIAIIALAVLYLLWAQVWTFIQDIYQEVEYRVGL